MAGPVETGKWPDQISGEWTVEALETLPDNGLRYEILDGTLLVTPAPTPRHQGAIVEPASPAAGRVPIGSQGLRRSAGLATRRPDVLGTRLDGGRRDQIGEKRITHPPTLVVDVLSPGIDRMIKFSRYAAGGIGQYWIVDPRVPSVQVFSLEAGTCVLVAEGAGRTPVSVTEPLAVTVIPRDLVDN